VDFGWLTLENFKNLATPIAGIVALVVYWMSKRNEKRNAATIVLMDIRHAEHVVQSILEKGAVDTFVKKIIAENNWSKYKHLFASDFSQDEFLAFNRFFESCMDISEARTRMLEIFNSGLRAKAEKLQQLLLTIDNPESSEGKEKRQELISNAHKETYIFEPDDPKLRIYRSLQLMGRLSNTIAFEKLKAISGIKPSRMG
jgi:hypothetical protein